MLVHNTITLSAATQFTCGVLVIGGFAPSGTTLNSVALVVFFGSVVVYYFPLNFWAQEKSMSVRTGTAFLSWIPILGVLFRYPFAYLMHR